MANKIKILGCGISDVTYDKGLEEVKKWLEERGRKHYIVTPNPEILVAARRNETFRQILNQADLALPDGIGLLWASRILGAPLKERVAGVDFMEKLCSLAEERGFSVGLIGGKPMVAVKVGECLKKKYPGLKIVLAQEEWERDKALRSPRLWRGSPRLVKDEIYNNNGTIEQFDNETIDILFVAFGAPKQEIWISQNLNHLPVRVAMGVGGAFDYLAGAIPRAPSWIRRFGLEWLFRLISQPWRLKRQSALVKFILLVLQEKLLLQEP